MRWPWQTAPGMVRVKDKDLVALQRAVLRAVELERETAAIVRERQLVEADMRARTLLEQRRTTVGEVAPAVATEVMASLPYTADGQLHEAAFIALVNTRVWDQWEKDRATPASTSTSTSHSGSQEGQER